MALKRFVGCILHGDTIADLPTHNTRWTDFKFVNLSNGDEWFNNGTAWVQFSGATKSEILQNKQINPLNNSISGILLDPFVSNRLEGWLIPGMSAADSLKGILKGMPSNGTYSLFYDSVEGWVSRFSTSIAERIGWYSISIPLITRREWNPVLKIRSKVSTTGNMGLWVGFSNTLPSLSHIPFANSSKFVVAGMSPSYTTNFQVIRNDGTNDSGVASSLGVAKNANFNTLEIGMDNTKVYAKINSTLLDNITVRLPTVSENLYLMIWGYNSEAVAKTFDVGKIYFSHDVV